MEPDFLAVVMMDKIRRSTHGFWGYLLLLFLRGFVALMPEIITLLFEHYVHCVFQDRMKLLHKVWLRTSRCNNRNIFTHLLYLYFYNGSGRCRLYWYPWTALLDNIFVQRATAVVPASLLHVILPY